MQLSIGQSILKAEFGAEQHEQTFAVDPDQKLVVMVLQGQNVMQVSRVHKVRFAEQYVALISDDASTFVPSDAIVALKSGSPQTERGDKRTGFLPR